MSDSFSPMRNFNLTVEERLELLKKLDKLQLYNNVDEVNDLISVEEQESFFAHFNLSFLDTIIVFFRQILYGESTKQYIFKKAIRNEINYLAHLNPPVLDKNGVFIQPYFINFLYDAGKISVDYIEFFKFWKKVIASKNNLISFSLYYFDKNQINNEKSLFEIFQEKKLIELIKGDKEYKKVIAQQYSLIKKHIRNNVEKLLLQLNQLYNLIIFFTYDFDHLFKLLYPIRFNDFHLDFFENQFPNVHIDKFANIIRPISRLFMVYPYFNEFSEESLKFFIDYYNEIFPDMQIDKNAFFTRLVYFTEQIQYYAAKDIINRLYRIIYKNPLLRVPFYSINLDLKTSFEKQIEQALDEKVKEAELVVEDQLFNEFYNILKEEGADKVKPLDANDSLILLLSKFDLPPLNYLKSYLIFFSFFKGIWMSKISNKVFQLVEFKYYYFPQSDIKSIKNTLEYLNQTSIDFDLIDKLANNIKIEMMKFEKKIPNKEDILKLSLLSSDLDSKMKQTLISGITTLLKMKNYLQIDNADNEVTIVKQQLNKFMDVLQRICPYDK